MQDQGIEEQRIVNTGLLPIARDLGLPLVCTNDVHYLRQADQHPHDVLLCIGTGKSVSDEKRLRYHGDQFFLKTRRRDGGGVRRLSRRAEEHDADRRALQRASCRRAQRTCRISRCRPGDDASIRTSSTMVRGGLRGARCRAARARGARRAAPARSPTTKRGWRTRSSMIKRMKYAGYFLIVWDFIRYARERGIPVGPGRGSAAGSLVAYCLRITDVDPLHFDLYFERFLNPERVVAARYRHRLLRAAPRRGHHLRHREIRPRERRADHHVRHDEGARRRARRRPRDGDADLRSRPGRQADPEPARDDARSRASRRTRR